MPSNSIIECIAISARTLEEAESAMKTAGIQTFGIESVTCPDDSPDPERTLYYVNRGDTYEETICREGEALDSDAGTEVLFVGSWGDWLEVAEASHEEETGTIRCGYCSKYTPYERSVIQDGQETWLPVAGEDWQEVECRHCRHLVGG